MEYCALSQAFPDISFSCAKEYTGIHPFTSTTSYLWSCSPCMLVLHCRYIPLLMSFRRCCRESQSIHNRLRKWPSSFMHCKAVQNLRWTLLLVSCYRRYSRRHFFWLFFFTKRPIQSFLQCTSKKPTTYMSWDIYCKTSIWETTSCALLSGIFQSGFRPLPLCRVSIGDRSIAVTGPRAWNSPWRHHFGSFAVILPP